MFTDPHNPNLINDVMRILGNKEANTHINPTPQWIVQASFEAAGELKEMLLSEQVVTSETKRDILRRHLSEAVAECNCDITKETPIQFEKEVEKRLNEGTEMPTQKAAIATPKEVAKKTAKPVSKPLPAKGGVVGKTAKEEIESDMRHFLTQLTEEEIDVLRDVVLEAKMGKKQMEKAVNDTFKKYFDRVQIPMMAIPKLYKEIESGLSTGKDPASFMPELVKKYQTN